MQLNEVTTICNSMEKGSMLKLQLGMVDNGLINELKLLQEFGLKGYLNVNQKSTGIGSNSKGSIIGRHIEITLSREIVLEFADFLNKTIK